MADRKFPLGALDVLEQGLVAFDPILLDKLLKDKTTGTNIRWGTNDYQKYGEPFGADKEIKASLVTGVYANVIQPRISKSEAERTRRTRNKAEVFTPSWLCNQQNNLIDHAWFGRKDVFNIEAERSWEPILDQIVFPEDKTWQDYVKDTRLEIACGEAPYLASRYDTVTGEILPISHRVGLLDRKLRIVDENTQSETEWLTWAVIAMQNIYGFDYQGDNVLLARENLLYTFADYYIDRFEKDPDVKLLRTIANIISWNIWQMDGITMTVPYFEKPKETTHQMSWSVELKVDESELQVNKTESARLLPCRIMDWPAKKSITYKSLIKG